ncbi:hypothetical protein QFZ94_003833 [Paraburkholderia sp. JPY465]|uniref:hypothetical protein n=1 Tax=Paraburkholderia sp. JPY465 TaxID=3042285 RepID=UPI003D1DF667
MKKFDPEKFLRTPLYAFDFRFMIGDVKDFLESSECNIDLQFQRELHAISQKDFKGFPAGYRDHLEENANYRFKVSLPLRVRYGALLALTTSVEWSVEILNKNATERVVAKRNKKECESNRTVEIMRELVSRTGLSVESTIDDYEALIFVRNCITHSAGIVDTYKHKKTLPEYVKRLRGIGIGNWQFFGDHICIERNALNEYIDEMANLIVNLHQLMHERGLTRIGTE